MKTALKMALVATVILSSQALGVTIGFDTDPFAGTTVLTTPGRQFVGNEVFLPTLDVATDLFSVNSTIFGVPSQLSFFNGLSANLPASGFNVIVLQDSDNDGNPATPFNAGTSADLIASRVDAPGPGFFIYFNSVLNLNRLVYSSDLSANTADIKILARILSPTGQGAIDALPGFSASNFETSAVPEPSSMGLTALGGMAGYWLVRRRKL